jgi:hypothetical protein
MGTLLRSRKNSKDFHSIRVRSAVANNKVRNPPGKRSKRFVSLKVSFLLFCLTRLEKEEEAR